MDTPGDRLPMIIGFVSNLMFTSKIESAAKQVGFDILWIPSQHEIFSQDLANIIPGQESLDVTWNPLLERITRIHPSLIVFDLENTDIPWRKWIALLKSSPATRRLPVICFGSHIDTEKISMAKDCGADAFFARSQIAIHAQQIIQKYSIITDNAGIESSCSRPLPELAIKGLEYFNKGKYFEAHEELELAWKADDSAGRILYQAVLQIGVAYLQIQRRNYWGAYKMFLRVRQWVDPLPATCRGINIGKLRNDANIVYRKLLELGPNRLDEFDPTLLKPVEYLVDVFPN